ncbi:MAG: hypothetical protein CM1200mP38_3660 [Dehalococcoidia bacterium]|nr:MAG: hypothetical protein CM1200mP38_3660 [Dehalococcoidia bacterium]
MYERPLLLKTLMAMATREINVSHGNLIDRLGNPVLKMVYAWIEVRRF